MGGSSSANGGHWAPLIAQLNAGLEALAAVTASSVSALACQIRRFEDFLRAAAAP